MDRAATPAKIILRSFLSPGDIVMLTAAVRDLHCCHPGRFLTDVRTSCPGLWENNPYLTPLDENDPEVRILDCEYPLIHQSNRLPYHFSCGYTYHLGELLGVPLISHGIRGDVHLSEDEKSWMSQVAEVTGSDVPFWVLAAGGKMDFTIKWWSAARYRRVVDHFRGRILFVQVGEALHYHPRIDGCLDLRGKTSLRQLIRLIHHAQGVLCPVTSLMHLAAAVEYRHCPGAFRPCVVVAGGREPPQWEAYPGHRFLHTVGALPCCSSGGCWRSRTVRLEDGDEKDSPESLCLQTAGPENLPKCMDMISEWDVIRAIESYFNGGAVAYLDNSVQIPGIVAAERQLCHS